MDKNKESKKKRQNPVFDPAKMSVYKNKGQRLSAL